MGECMADDNFDPTKVHAALVVVSMLAALTILPTMAATPALAATNSATNTAATNSPTDTSYDFTIPRDGDAYTVGFPAAVNGTLADVLPPNETGYAVYQFDAGAQSWSLVTDFERAEVRALSAVVVLTENVSDSDPIPVTVPLDADQRTPPSTELTAGWNFVAGPQYDIVSAAFGVDHSYLAVDVFEAPTAVDKPPAVRPFGATYVDRKTYDLVSPFKGYFVYAEADTRMPGVVANADNRTELNNQLDVDWFEEEE